MTWIRNDIHQLKDVPEAVSIKTIRKNMTVGRYLYGRIIRQGIYKFGKIFAHGSDEFYFMDISATEDKPEYYEAYYDYPDPITIGFQVLVCAPVKEAPCGTT